MRTGVRPIVTAAEITASAHHALIVVPPGRMVAEALQLGPARGGWPAGWAATRRLLPAPRLGAQPKAYYVEMSDRPSGAVSSDRVLIVEDEAAQRMGLEQLAKSWGFDVSTASNGEEALQQAASVRPTIVLSDLVMPRMGGLDLLKALKLQDPEVTFVIMTAQGTVDTAVEDIKLGAYDYVSNPIDPQRLRILLDQIVERHGTLREVRVLRKQLREHGSFGKLIGQSRAMQKVYEIIEQAAPTNASVLVSGESGTGKELVAQTVHLVSPRAGQPFVPINCAAIPETLLESELFGHEKGAFTGAIARRQGAFELAHRGTLFLDEIGEMTPATQAKLLRVLQERTFRTLGGQREQTVDIRVIAATNIEPLDAVRQNKLREDLYYRLNVFAIQLPPLRDRKDDQPILIESFIADANRRNNRKSIGGVTARARHARARAPSLARQRPRTAERPRAGDHRRPGPHD